MTARKSFRPSAIAGAVGAGCRAGADRGRGLRLASRGRRALSRQANAVDVWRCCPGHHGGRSGASLRAARARTGNTGDHHGHRALGGRGRLPSAPGASTGVYLGGDRELASVARRRGPGAPAQSGTTRVRPGI